MPELPEIENLAAALRPRLVGKTVVDVRCRQPKVLNWPTQEFAARVRDAGPVADVTRRGKSCVLRLADGGIWLHLGLGGVVSLAVPEAESVAKEPQLAVVFAGGEELTVDKTFMGHAHYYAEAEFAVRWQSFGPDPNAADFDPARLRAVLAAKPKQALKALFMDQARLAGIGNLYSDEILHAARLHPGRAAGSLNADEMARLHAATREVLATAIATGGEPTYLSLDGTPGHYEMRVHKADFCLDCGGPVTQATLAGRTGYYCPRCQS